jgi:drug/metabolite transporter (DMT)-like permease
MQRYSPLHVIRWVFTFGFFFILPFGWTEVPEVQNISFETRHFVALFAVVVTGTFLAYHFNAFGIQHLGASTTGSYIYTQPVFAVLIATFFLGELLTLQKIVAGCAIFMGVFLVSFRRN